MGSSAALLYDYHPRSRRGTVLFRSPQESLFDFSIVHRTEIPGSHATDVIPDERMSLSEGHSEMKITYAHRSFDPRRLCESCTEELRAAIITHGHDRELWHTVDHERRALLTAQRQGDLWKARWLERNQQDRQVTRECRHCGITFFLDCTTSGNVSTVLGCASSLHIQDPHESIIASLSPCLLVSLFPCLRHVHVYAKVAEVLRLICEANLDSFSHTTLEKRSQAAKDAQAAEVRRLLDVKLSNQAAVRDGASKDEMLKRLNVREAGENARVRR